MLKKLIVSSILSLGLIVNAPAASTSFTLASGSCTNLIAPYTGGAKLTQLTATSVNASFQVFDASSTNLTIVYPAYVSTTYTAGLQTNLWTNYYGVINSNVYTGMVTTLTTNAAVTNAAIQRIAASCTNNVLVKFDNVNYYFANGVFLTNTGPQPIIVTATYQK